MDGILAAFHDLPHAERVMYHQIAIATGKTLDAALLADCQEFDINKSINIYLSTVSPIRAK